LFSNGRAASLGLSVIVAAGLAVDAYVHLDLAGNYDAVKTSTLSQGDLFRAEAAVAILAALAILIRPRWYTAAFAVVVAASALAALLVYRYDNLGAIGPLPSMYEPVWFAKKTVAAIAEAVSTLTAAALLAVVPRPGRLRR
jgi:hypothetical protein